MCDEDELTGELHSLTELALFDVFNWSERWSCLP
jgi:hypothetical protein